MSRSRLTRIAVGMLTLLAVGQLAQLPRLPRDDWFGLLLHLMWQGTYSLAPIVVVLFASIQAVVIGVACLLLVAALALPRASGTRLESAARWCVPYSIAIALLSALTGNLGRYAANAHYLLSDVSLVELTPSLVRLEGGFILWFQSRAASSAMDSLMASIYSVWWVIAIIAPVALFVGKRLPISASQAVVGPALMSLIALPLHVLLPVYDPWSFNPAYGSQELIVLLAEFRYPDADPALLTEVSQNARRVVGACFPSLHVGLPAYFGMVAVRAGSRPIAMLYAACTGVVIVSTVYLGRHWMMDALAGVALARLVLWLVERWRLNVALTPESSSTR